MELPVTWWGVVDPDPRGGLHLSSILVAAVPAAGAVFVAVLRLTSESRRRWFGPMVGVAAAVWLLEVVAGHVVYDDHASGVDPHAGLFLIGVGLLVCIVAATYDALPSDWW